MNIEHAEGARVVGASFPDSWGRPEDRQYSVERAAWVRRHVKAEMRTRPLDQLARRDIRLLNSLQLALVNSKRAV
jgi:hypothetical protein